MQPNHIKELIPKLNEHLAHFSITHTLKIILSHLPKLN